MPDSGVLLLSPSLGQSLRICTDLQVWSSENVDPILYATGSSQSGKCDGPFRRLRRAAVANPHKGERQRKLIQDTLIMSAVREISGATWLVAVLFVMHFKSVEADKSKLRVCTCADYPPFVMPKGKDITGIEVCLPSQILLLCA